MNLIGKIKEVSQDWVSHKWNVTFEVNELPTAEVQALQQEGKLNIDVKKYRKRRSLNANGLLWLCIGQIASELKANKWDVYLQMLKRYGKYTYICVKPSVVEAVKMQWRECEEIGEIDINGQKSVQMLCYFGSSTYNTKEFSVLLDGVISEMKEMELRTPSQTEIERIMEQYEQIM